MEERIGPLQLAVIMADFDIEKDSIRELMLAKRVFPELVDHLKESLLDAYKFIETVERIMEEEEVEKGFYYIGNDCMSVWDMTTNPELLDRKSDVSIPLDDVKDFLRARGVHIDRVLYGTTGFFGGASYKFICK